MSEARQPQAGRELDDFLSRQSALTAAYAALEKPEPPAALDAKIMSAALSAPAAVLAAKPAPRAPEAVPPETGPPHKARTAGAASVPGTASPRATAPAPDNRQAEADDDDRPPFRRPRWLIPAALALAAVLAIGLGLQLTGGFPGSSVSGGNAGSLFARRAKERSEAAQREAEDAARAEAEASARTQAEAEVVELDNAPPPPVFQQEVPVVADLDRAIVFIRKSLTPAGASDTSPGESPAPVAGATADAGSAASGATTGVIQPRERRLAKILELYDSGDKELASEALDIFLRDFPDDPVSQRIIEISK